MRPVMAAWKTARETALEFEKERKQKRADEEVKRRAKERRREDKVEKIGRAEKEREEVGNMEGWIEKINWCPVYKPTKEEFEDPLKYIATLTDEVAPKYGMCKIIPPYVNGALTGRDLFGKPDFQMEVRKQPLKMVDWSEKEKQGKDVNFNKDTRKWTFKEFEAFANDFVERNYEGSSSQLQYRFIEREFWKEFLLRRNKHVRYASDVPGTAFDKEEFEELARSKWNLGKLPTLEDSVLRNVDVEIPGVTKPMLYVGMLFSMFAWHVEDQYLYSINYHHLGAPKTWYGVPGCAAQDFERVAREKVFNLPEDSEGVARTLWLLIGKTIMFPPKHIVEEGVPVCRAVQQPGEFVVTYPRSYHAGYSNGFNCGEAVNFAMVDWLPFGVACTRRYRHLRHIQVVAFDELLCKDAHDLHQRMKEGNCQVTAMDECVMVEFVRLLQWQYRQRWMLHLWGAEPVPMGRLGGGSIECALCHHKNYLSYVICDCPEMIAPVCLNHPAELRACRCQPSPAPLEHDQVPGRQVIYLQDLPLLEAIASDFESQPGIQDKIVAAAENELKSPELQDQWQLCGREEAPMGRGEQPALAHTAESSPSACQLWAPIPGYNYELMRAVRPGTSSQETRGAGEASQGRVAGELPPPEKHPLGGALVQAQESRSAFQVPAETSPFSSPGHAPLLLPPATQLVNPVQAPLHLGSESSPGLAPIGGEGGLESAGPLSDAVPNGAPMHTESNDSESQVGQKEWGGGQGKKMNATR